MDIKVTIEIKNEFGTECCGISESKNIDNEIITSGINNEFDLVVEHINNALQGAGYTTNLIQEDKE